MKGSETVSLAKLVIQWTDPEVFRSSQADADARASSR